MLFRFFLFFTVVISLSISCKKKTNSDFHEYYFSGAEIVNSDGLLTDSLGYSAFKNGKIRTDEYAFEGNYSIRLDSTNKYGFQCSFDSPEAGELFQASVWIKGIDVNGTLYASTQGRLKRNFKSRTTNTTKNGWTKLEINIIIKNNVDKISFHVSAGGKIAYFDNIMIRRFHQAYPENHVFDQQLNIHIPEDSQTLLDSYIKNAETNWMIPKRVKKYIPAFIITKKDSIPIEMRLKGDWADHLYYGKISYRIKVLGNHDYNGLKTFSIQDPYTRNYQHEWFIHKVMDQGDLLSTKYNFSGVIINGSYCGIYALEEHFDKQLLENRSRREGPILKMDENGMWAAMVYSKENNIPNNFPFYESSIVSMFKKNRTLKNANLKNCFIDGSRLLNLFKNNHLNLEDIFDMKSLAKMYAILEFGNIHHGFAWHNRRFYFNPITNKLEFIGYDLLPGEENKYFEEPYSTKNLLNKKDLAYNNLDRQLFINSEFREFFTQYLIDFSDKITLDSIFHTLKSEIDLTEELLAFEHENYTFDKNFYYSRAKNIKTSLPQLDSIWNEYEKLSPEKFEFDTEKKYVQFTDSTFLKTVSINCYLSQIDSSNYKVSIDNYCTSPVSVLGYKTKGSKEITYFENPIKLKEFDGQNEVSTISKIINKKPSRIVFSPENLNGKLINSKLLKWPKPEGVSSRMELKNKFKLKSKYYSISDSTLTFNSGNYQISELLYIPEKYNIIISSNTHIDFVNGGGIIATNSFTAIGDAKDDISFHSSDGNNHGITILQAPEVILKNVYTNGLDALHYNRWNLTGAITIYESETNIETCIFNDNICEDGLNIIRSHFEINHLLMNNTFSDGFDADFCTGTVSNSTISNTGNDCIDFSGSTISLENINISSSGDKGISGGERSYLTLENITIDKATIGIAAKDDTQISGNNIRISLVDYSLAAFQKKAEYGVAFIDIKNSKMGAENLIDAGSKICIDGTCEVGENAIDLEEMYSRFVNK